jgi:hypothetical protein
MEPKKLNIAALKSIIETYLTHEDRSKLAKEMIEYLNKDDMLNVILELTKDMYTCQIDEEDGISWLIYPPTKDKDEHEVLCMNKTFRDLHKKQDGKYYLNRIDGSLRKCILCKAYCIGHNVVTDDEWYEFCTSEYSIYPSSNHIIT